MRNRLPSWFKQDLPEAATRETSKLIYEYSVHTVCREAKCPNINSCFKHKRVTFMILGKTCTRNCRFCNVTKAEDTGLFFEEEEPERISRLVKALGLDYVVITSVSRDDLADGGASVFAKTIVSVRAANKDVKIEVLIPDFQGKTSSLKSLLSASPEVVAHNLETVSRLYNDLRPQADYGRSLDILSKIKELASGIFTKSSLMLGMGEKREEVIAAMQDLRNADCDILTLGQYLAPSSAHYPVNEYIDIERFKEYKDLGLRMGFRAVLSGPSVRSSYKAEELFTELTYV